MEEILDTYESLQATSQTLLLEASGMVGTTGCSARLQAILHLQEAMASVREAASAVVREYDDEALKERYCQLILNHEEGRA